MTTPSAPVVPTVAPTAAPQAVPVGPPAVPAPRSHPVTPAWTAPDHLQLAMSRLRVATPVDSVEFEARCPGCGEDCAWQEQREDTRLIVQVHCACAA